MLRSRFISFILFTALAFLVSGICLPWCLAQEAGEPPVEEEKPTLAQLQEKLSEYLALMRAGEIEDAFVVLEEYLTALKELADNPEGLPEMEMHAAHVLYVTSKHLAVLMRVYEKAPETARKGIANAMSKSTRGHNNAFDFLEKNGQEDGDEDGTKGMETLPDDGQGKGEAKGKGKKHAQ